MIIKNVKVYTEDKTFENGMIFVKNGVFGKVLTGQKGTESQGAV